MIVRGVARLRARPSQSVGDLCEDCGAVLVLCVQCGAASRCLACCPYERPTDRDDEMHTAVRLVRAHPEVGLLAGAVVALVPTMLVWAGMTFCGPGLARASGSLAGAVACGAFLAAGTAWGGLPLPGEVPQCQARKVTPYDRWARAGCGALLVQVVLICVGSAAT